MKEIVKGIAKTVIKKEDNKKKAEELINHILFCKTLLENAYNKVDGDKAKEYLTEIEKTKKELLELF